MSTGGCPEPITSSSSFQGPLDRSQNRGRRKPPQLMDRNVPQLYPDRWNVAVDAETGRVIERFQGDIGAGWKTNSRALPVEGHGGVELVQLRGP